MPEHITHLQTNGLEQPGNRRCSSDEPSQFEKHDECTGREAEPSLLDVGITSHQTMDLLMENEQKTKRAENSSD